MVIAGSVGTGLFFFASTPHNSATNQLGSPDAVSTNAVSSSASSSSSTPALVSPGQPQTVFGFVVNSTSDTVASFPNDTMIWTNHVLSSSSYVAGITTSIVTTPSSSKSNVIIAAYINGNLVGEEKYEIGPPVSPSSNPSYTLPSNFTQANEVTVQVGSTIQSGSTISVAIWCSCSPTIHVDSNDPTARGTYEYALPSTTTSLPQTLPSSAQSASSAPDFWAFSQGQ